MGNLPGLSEAEGLAHAVTTKYERQKNEKQTQFPGRNEPNLRYINKLRRMAVSVRRTGDEKSP